MKKRLVATGFLAFILVSGTGCRGVAEALIEGAIESAFGIDDDGRADQCYSHNVRHCSDCRGYRTYRRDREPCKPEPVRVTN